MMNSCAYLTGFEEGRSLGESNSEFGISGNFTVAPNIFEDTDIDSVDLSGSVSFPNIKLNYKYGISENFDIGAKLNTNLNLGVYTKYQLVGDKTSNFALAPGLEFATFAGLGYAVHVPIYTSIYPSEKLTINLSPRFVYQFATGNATAGVTYIGGNAGLLFGKKHKFGLDFGYYTVGSDGDRATLMTFGIGGRFRFGDNMDSGLFNSDDSNERRRRRSRR